MHCIKDLPFEPVPAHLTSTQHLLSSLACFASLADPILHVTSVG